MLNAIPKPVMVGAGVFLVLVAALYVAYDKGYNSAVAAYNAEAAELAEAAKKKQAEHQRAIDDLAGRYVEAIEAAHTRKNELDSLKDRLRGDRYVEPESECFCMPGRVMPAIYRLYNEAIRSEYLSGASDTLTPDEAGDGLEVVQYTAGEYNRVAVQLNTLQSVIRQSDCFVK